jgi:hypothetical protein
LLWGTRAVLAFAHVLNLFANELAGLRRRRFTLHGVAMRTLDYIFFWHKQFLSDEAGL